MKKVVLILCIISAIAFTAGIAFGDPTIFVKTNKTMYLMDPWYWVYSASKFTYWYPPYANPNFWDSDGNPRTISFTTKIYDEKGSPMSLGSVPFDVFDNATGLASGFAVEDLSTPGTYTGSFSLTENDLGRDTFTGQTPKELTLKVTAQSTVKEHRVFVGRWGCDRCHIPKEIAMQIYPWTAPTGGPLGPHYWGNILGRNNTPEGFDLTYLTDSSKTHTPVDFLNAFPYHEKTIQKQCGNIQCSPCHQGSGTLRAAWGGTGYPTAWLDHAKGEAVECTFCHGIEGGYVPANGLSWAENAGYIIEAHRHNNVPPPPDSPRSPYLARQSCSNFGCHGHINNDTSGKIDNAKPDCRLCHGIHN